MLPVLRPYRWVLDHLPECGRRCSRLLYERHEEDEAAGMVAKAYRLLRAVLWTAVKEDELLKSNPCRIPGADKESAEERPHLNLAQVTRLMKAMPERYRLMVLLAAMASLRFGEITALQRLVTLLRAHLDERCASAPDALLLSLVSGLPIRRSSFNKLTNWRAAVASIGVPNLHFHDLRQTGNMLAAGSKVTTKDLMARMGHDSMQAALIYQHASREADVSIAAHLNKQLEGLNPAKTKKKLKTKKKDRKATNAKAIQNLNGRRGELAASPGIDGRFGPRGGDGTDDEDGEDGAAGVPARVS